MDPPPAPAAAEATAAATPPHQRRQRRGGGGSRIVEWTIHFALSFVILSLLKLEPIARNSIQEHKNINESDNLPLIAAATELENNNNNDDDPDAAYLKWLQEERKRSTNLTSTEEPIFIRYRAMNGLGHQLVRLSSAYHLAMLYQIPRVWITHNPVCGGTIFTIYDHLIGEGKLIVDIPFFGHNNNLYQNRSIFNPIPVGWPHLSLVNETSWFYSRMQKQQYGGWCGECQWRETTISCNKRVQYMVEKYGTSENEARESIKQDCKRKEESPNREINLINEVPGYAHAMMYKTWKPNGYHEQNNFYGKELSDYQMYHQIMLLFEHRHKKRIKQVLESTRFKDHTVFGLHIRAGNGEGGDFTKKGRKIDDFDGWIKRIVNLLCGYQLQHSHYFTEKPLMIYVGTDTGSVINKLHSLSKATCQIPFVSAEQSYPEEGKSVTWSHKYDDKDKCLKGWEDMMLDMFMFTRCNSVLAGSYSSFTQSAPLSFIMHKARQLQHHQHQNQQNGNNSSHPHYFCDIGVDARRMDCSSTLIDWLRLTPDMTWGDNKAKKQNMRHEITFPHEMRSPREIVQTFRGSLMMDMDVRRFLL